MSGQVTRFRALALVLTALSLLLFNQVAMLSALNVYESTVAPGTGEELRIHVEVDMERPRTLLDHVRGTLRRWGGSWVGGWLVGGHPVSTATVSVAITVTGTNVEPTAKVDYYIEAQPRDGGQACKVLEGLAVEVPVNGDPLSDASTASITSHLEAMMLPVDQTWAVDYAVYARARATGSITGNTLTSEVKETVFDAVEYQHVSTTWTQIPVAQEQLGVGHATLESQSLYTASSSHPEVEFGEVTNTCTSTAWFSFRNSDGSNPMTGDDFIIHEAYVELQAYDYSPAQRVTLHLHNATWWSITYWNDWAAAWENRLPVNVVWETEAWQIYGIYPVRWWTTDSPLITDPGNEWRGSLDYLVEGSRFPSLEEARDYIDAGAVETVEFEPPWGSYTYQQWADLYSWWQSGAKAHISSYQVHDAVKYSIHVNDYPRVSGFSSFSAAASLLDSSCRVLGNPVEVYPETLMLDTPDIASMLQELVDTHSVEPESRFTVFIAPDDDPGGTAKRVYGWGSLAPVLHVRYSSYTAEHGWGDVSFTGILGNANVLALLALIAVTVRLLLREREAL